MIDSLIQASEHLAGFVIVVTALCLLWGLTAVMGKLFAPRPAGKGGAAPAATPAPATSSKATDASAIGDDDLVVIAATVARLLDERHRIVSIRPQASSWGQQGRRDIHASHRIR